MNPSFHCTQLLYVLKVKKDLLDSSVFYFQHMYVQQKKNNKQKQTKINKNNTSNSNR